MIRRWLPNRAKRGPGLGALCLVLLLGICEVTPLAANPQYRYRGHDTTYPNIMIDLFLTDIGGRYDVTGTVYVANFMANVTGILAGGGLSANLSYPLGSAARGITTMTGTLSGSPGIGTLYVSTDYVDINGAIVKLSFVLPPPGSAGPPPVGTPHSIALPSNLHLTGDSRFGYTVVSLSLDLTLRGSVYEARGNLVVNQIRPTVVRTTLGVAGTLPRRVMSTLTVYGAPPGSNPVFTGTLDPLSGTFNGRLSGIPALLITGLYIDASQ
jgi:hypothetical protein